MTSDNPYEAPRATDRQTATSGEESTKASRRVRISPPLGILLLVVLGGGMWWNAL